MQVAVREFKDRLSELLRRAQAGEEIVVTSRGRPVARLGPADPCAPTDPEEALRETLSGWWSHRVDDEHRLIVRLEGPTLVILACQYHDRFAQIIRKSSAIQLAQRFATPPGAGGPAGFGRRAALMTSGRQTD